MTTQPPELDSCSEIHDIQEEDRDLSKQTGAKHVLSISDNFF